MNMKFLDKATIGSTKKTKEGYLLARSRVARTGMQDYLAKELGDVAKEAGFAPNDIVKVYRSPEAVFDKDSLASLTRAPVTIDHPGEDVTADTWAKYAVGEIGDRYMIEEAEGWIAVDPMIKDADAITKAETTHREWSMGYSAKIRPSQVSDADFEMYDIRFNHIAAVPRGRAGSEARIGDSAANQWGVSPLTTSNEVPKMDTKAVAIGDKAYTVLAADADQLAKAFADKDTAIGELKAKLADAESKILTDEQMQAKVKELADAMARREAVKAKFGDEAVKDASDAEIAGMFKIIDKAPAQDDTARKALAGAMKSKAEEKDDPWAKLNAKKKGDK